MRDKYEIIKDLAEAQKEYENRFEVYSEYEKRARIHERKFIASLEKIEKLSAELAQVELSENPDVSAPEISKR